MGPEALSQMPSFGILLSMKPQQIDTAQNQKLWSLSTQKPVRITYVGAIVIDV